MVKKVAKKDSDVVASSVNDAERLNRAQLAIKAIKKHVSLDPLEFSVKQYDYIDSGSFAVNDLIGGSVVTGTDKSVCPGYPRGRIVEIFGPESSGKTTLVLHAIAQAQKAGGLAAFLDYEHALDYGYAKKIGVSFDPDKLLLYAPNIFEEGLKIISVLLQAGVDLIAVDSVPSMVPREEMELAVDKEGRWGALSRAMSKSLPKITAWMNDPNFRKLNKRGTCLIFLNQERADVGGKTPGGSKTTGGYALKFYSSIRLRTVGIRKESTKRKDTVTGQEVNSPYGTITQVKVVKNKIDAKSGQSHNIFIRYGYGIDEIYSLIEAGVFYKFIKKSGAFYEYAEENYQGREKLRTYFIKHPESFAELREKIKLQISGLAGDDPGEIEEEDESEDDLLLDSAAASSSDYEAVDMSGELGAAESDG